MLAALAVIAAFSCARKPPTLVIGRIVLAAPAAFDHEAGRTEALRSALAARLDQDATVDWRPKSNSPTHVLHVEVGEVLDRMGDAEDTVPVTVRLQPTHKGALYAASGRGLPLADAVSSALVGFDDAWAVVSEQRRLDVADDARMIIMLKHPDPRLRGFAIERLGERKARAAVEPLCELLGKEPEQELVLRTVGSLVAIRDSRAVEPLIDLTRHKDPQFVVQVIFALSTIGGTTAEAYLVTLASGHPLEAVRRSAEDALAEMQHREAPAK
ncbi:MAG: HEAT repeat domain-containing protein [Deltaproteobacteria bacterium]|nr:HEAT repeat domain-containing protein [Deltaproteobacteria bacterium]